VGPVALSHWPLTAYEAHCWNVQTVPLTRVLLTLTPESLGLFRVSIFSLHVVNDERYSTVAVPIRTRKAAAHRARSGYERGTAVDMRSGKHLCGVNRYALCSALRSAKLSYVHAFLSTSPPAID
jgi:hypothetical protein